MPSITTGTWGFGLQFTYTLPVKAQSALENWMKAQGKTEVPSFGLTPSLGAAPTLQVSTLRKGNVEVPEHWGDNDAVFPVIDGIAFYITPQFPSTGAASFAMRGVNIRTGQREVGKLTDQPCQSYWSQQPPWIDGYVPSHGEAVRQFVMLRGAGAQRYDVSNAVGIDKNDPAKDALTMACYFPKDMRRMRTPEYSYRSAVLGDVMPEAAMSLGAPEEVGVGAGALMKQRHQDDPASPPSLYQEKPFVVMVGRLVWVDQWNKWAAQLGEEIIKPKRLEQLEESQKEYEKRIWQSIGGRTKQTSVDDLPSMG